MSDELDDVGGREEGVEGNEVCIEVESMQSWCQTRGDEECRREPGNVGGTCTDQRASS